LGTPSTSIVLPVHNQQGHIRQIVKAHIAALVPAFEPIEIVLVPNASTDDSVEACNALAVEDRRVRVVELDEGGWGRAVRAGLAASGGDVLCYTNSARTTPEMLTLMLRYSRAFPDVVLKANRRIRDNRRRRFGSLLYNLECRVLFDLAIWDINGTPKIFPRTFDQLLALTRNDDLVDTEFALVCERERYPMLEVPILATVRHGGKTTTSYSSALKLYAGAYRFARGKTG
jgi:glycosyltransferase involved in cell wall biosynthesis